MHLDPDECPSLLDASKILFPHLCRQMKAEDCPEAEYEAEMLERISEVSFLSYCEEVPTLIPISTSSSKSFSLFP